MSPCVVEELRSLHKDCRDCLLPVDHERIGKARTNCPVSVVGLRLAIDCDKCAAFDEGKKPDIVALQACGELLTWILIEMKDRVESSARHQLESGLTKIKTSRLFQAKVGRAEMYVLFRKNSGNEADRKKLDNMNLTFRGKAVIVATKRCGITISCSEV